MIEIRQTVHSNLMTFRGSSQEDKPMTCAPGSTFYEWDTASGYMFDGEEWLLQTSGGGGGTSFGTAAKFLCCPTIDGVPQPSDAVGGGIVCCASKSDMENEKYMVGGAIVDPDSVSPIVIAAGLYVGFVLDGNAQIPDTSTATLYIYNTDTHEMTEVADALTSYTDSGYLYSFSFTMQDVEDADNEVVLIGIENDDQTPTE